MTKIVKVAKTKTAKIQLQINLELVSRLIKQGRKTAAVNHYQELTGAKAAEAMAVDAQMLCEKTSASIEKATTDVARENAVITLIDNARALNFKSSVKSLEKAEKVGKISKAEKLEKVGKISKAEKAEKVGKISKAEKAEKVGKISKAEKLEKKAKKIKVQAEDAPVTKLKKLKKKNA